MSNQTPNPMPSLKLEVVPLPVSDIERAKTFYVDKLGFNLDHDVQPSDTMRVVQLTPPGSACSIVIGTGMGEISAVPPGTIKGLHLVVEDVSQVRQILVERGVELSETVEYPDGMKYVYLSDPDGNSWALQEIPAKYR